MKSGDLYAAAENGGSCGTISGLLFVEEGCIVRAEKPKAQVGGKLDDDDAPRLPGVRLYPGGSFSVSRAPVSLLQIQASWGSWG